MQETLLLKCVCISYTNKPQNINTSQTKDVSISGPELYGDLVYKFKRIMGSADFSDQLRKEIIRYKRIGFNLNAMRQSECLVINPITVDYFASLFNCTSDRASDSMMVPT